MIYLGMPKPLHECTEEELQAELLQRRLMRAGELGSNWETVLTAPQLKDTETLFSEHLAQMSAREPREMKPCPKCGANVSVRSRPSRTIRSMAGVHQFKRNYHYCNACRAGFHPLDRALGLSEKGDLSPEMEKRVLDFGVHGPFASAAERFAVHHGFGISDNMVRGVVKRIGERWDERSSDGRATALNVKPIEADKTLVVQMDGSMLCTRSSAENQAENNEPRPWREAKTGMIYLHENLVKKDGGRNNIFEPKYVSALRDYDGFKRDFAALLKVHGAAKRQRILFIADGAACNWTTQQELCPNAIQILDFYHAVEHLGTAANAVFGKETAAAKAWLANGRRRLLEESPSKVLRWLAYHAKKMNDGVKKRAALEELIAYFNSHCRRMKYAEYRNAGFPIGSGAIESAQVRVLQIRMKAGGMSWSLTNGQNLARLRAAALTVGPLKLYPTLSRAA